jgi:hypothetical protein
VSPTQIVQLCEAEQLCMKDAAHKVTVYVEGDGKALSRAFYCCPRCLQVLKDHADRRGRENPELTISVSVVPL